MHVRVVVSTALRHSHSRSEMERSLFHVREPCRATMSNSTPITAPAFTGGIEITDETIAQDMDETERSGELGMATGTASRERFDTATTHAADEPALSKRFKFSTGDSEPETFVKDKLTSIWSNVMDEDSEAKAFAETVEVFTGEVESLIRSGLDAYQQCEMLRREIKVLTGEVAAKTLEIERLRASEESNRMTIQVRM